MQVRQRHRATDFADPQLQWSVEWAEMHPPHVETIKTLEIKAK